MSTVAIRPPNRPTQGSWYTSQAVEQVKQVFAGKGVLHKIVVSNSNAAARFVWVFDNTASSGVVLLAVIPLAAASGFADITLQTGIPFSTGLRVASSSTAGTFTASASNDLIMTVGFTASLPTSKP